MPDKPDPLRLAELLSARMSHDLGGTIGTLAAALELAIDETPEPSEALSLAVEAAEELRARLKLVRAAWGPAGEDLSPEAVHALAAGLHDDGRMTLDIALPDDAVIPAPTGRVVLNLLLLAREALPAGGVVTLTGTPDDLVVSIAGPRATWPAGLATCLTSEANAWAAVKDARSLQAPLTTLLARSLGLRLSLLLPGGPSTLLPMLRLSKS
jgi:histidine phosphotransferase ChpT